jgi:uncharacterized protein YecE (DUF72 family)
MGQIDKEAPGMIRLGTSGFSYDDWVGPVYPEGLPRQQWLSFYAQEFDTVELNVSYYRLPTARMVDGWVEKTPDHFLFSVKAHRSLTHERENPDFEAFRQSIDGLLQADKLACVLAQFPHSFHPTPPNRDYLKSIREGLADLPIVVEFRGRDWVSEETFEQLKGLELGFCCVDEPKLRGLMPPIARATSDVAYIRFHGRNEAKWWHHDQAWERYDYTYTVEELRDWLPKIHSLDTVAYLTLV